MAEETTESFIGRGWTFPPTFEKGSKGVKMIDDEEDIKSSLHVLLSTRIGERIMRPSYGCNLDHLIFENIDTTLKTFIADLIKTAILYHEPRIDIDKVSIQSSDESEGKILILLDYRIRTTNSRQNYVYPFYLNEGTELG